MCGVCGVIHFDGRPVARAPIEAACAAMRHRGPDDRGVWIGGVTGGDARAASGGDARATHARPGTGARSTDARPGTEARPTPGAASCPSRGAAIGLGAVRLAILDPTPAGHQPMTDPTGRFVLAYNGELYNFRALRRTLAGDGHRFRTDCDTEVVLAACMRWGVDALRRFNGMWALAFVDAASGEGFLSRDRFGIKPLMVAQWGRSLAFASELRALGPLGDWDRAIDPDAVGQHVQFGYIAHPRTIHLGARRLAPGHVLRFTGDGVVGTESYYRLGDVFTARDTPDSIASRGLKPADRGDDDDPCAPPDGAEAGRMVRRMLFESVVRRRVSDVPIGAFLSGGLDSSIVVSHLAESSGRPIQTFAVGYPGRGSYDETQFARIVAEHFGTDHHELMLTDDDVLGAVPSVLDHLGEPVGDSSIIPTSLVSKFAASSVTVALSGDGGDELFGGYWRYLGHDAWKAYHRLPGWLRRALIDPASRLLSSSKGGMLGNRVRQFRKLLRTSDPDAIRRHVAWSRILSPEAESVFADEGVSRKIDDEICRTAESLTGAFSDDDPLRRIMAFDLQYNLPADMLQKVDLASMMHSLEVRVPFLDPDLVAAVARWPSALKIRGGLRKRVLVDAYRGHLPDRVLDRPKMGFEVPIGEYLRGPLDGMFRDVVTRERIESVPQLSWAGVQRVHANHLARRGEHADVLFALLSLCWWMGNSPAGSFQKS